MYYPYQVRGKIVRRGDYTKLFTDAKREDEEFSVVVFLVRKWKKNDYGELYLYVFDNLQYSTFCAWSPVQSSV